MNSKTSQCRLCKRRFKKLTEEELCYYCHVNKYGSSPKEWNPIGKYKK